MTEFRMPTETIELPSKGLLYPKDNPLSLGKIEMSYLTAASEDILTNSNYIKQGTVVDKLLQSLIISPINYDDLLVGDKNAIFISARILGYGKNYNFKYRNADGKEVEGVVDLTTLKDKELDESLFKSGINEFDFELPHSKNKITFKFLTHGDEKKIDAEVKGLQKLSPTNTFSITSRLKYMILSVNGDKDIKTIREFVDKALLAPDSRAFRQYYNEMQPDIITTFMPDDENYTGEGVNIPIGITFLWPDADI